MAELITEAEPTTRCCYPAKDVTADVRSGKLSSLTLLKATYIVSMVPSECPYKDCAFQACSSSMGTFCMLTNVGGVLLCMA